MSIIGYVRVSTRTQDREQQRLALLDYAHARKISISKILEYTVSSRKSTHARGLSALQSALAPGDTVIVAELSRLGRSLSEIVRIVDDLHAKRIGLICIKEGIEIGQNALDLKTKVLVSTFALCAEIERTLISERTKDGLAAARKNGRIGGRRPGSFSSPLTPHDAEVRALRAKGLSISSIAKYFSVSYRTAHFYCKSRGL